MIIKYSFNYYDYIIFCRWLRFVKVIYDGIVYFIISCYDLV